MTDVNKPQYARIPQPVIRGRKKETSIEVLYISYMKQIEIEQGKITPYYYKANRYACGYPLPDFQREFVWTEDQSIRFIESAFLGIDIGYYAVHGWDHDDKDKIMEFSGILLDGQQRLTTLNLYWENKFKVFDLYWSDLNISEKRRFLKTTFQSYEVEIWEIESIKHYYNTLAFGGTAHNEEDRA